MLSRLESEPSVVWNGWGVAFCVAAFILGIVAASDNGPSIPQAPELRVRGDPQELPFSNQAAWGFENPVAVDPKLVSRK
jgi:hypothetical protein